MNSIELRLEQLSELTEEGAVGVLIDGTDLIARLKDLERPLACAEGHPKIVGACLGLPPSAFLSWLELAPDGRSTILGCECGVFACWPFCVRITIDAATVKWLYFQQPFRPNWNYAGLGPFIFARAQYCAEIARIRAAR